MVKFNTMETNKKYTVQLKSESKVESEGRSTVLQVEAPTKWQALLRAMRIWSADHYSSQWPVTKFYITEI